MDRLTGRSFVVNTPLPLPFDVLLVDDSSRVARDRLTPFACCRGSDLPACASSTASVRASTAPASRPQRSSRLTASWTGCISARWRKRFAAALRGQHARGFATGGRTYGYRSVAVPDPTRKGTSRSAIGSRLSRPRRKRCGRPTRGSQTD